MYGCILDDTREGSNLDSSRDDQSLRDFDVVLVQRTVRTRTAIPAFRAGWGGLVGLLPSDTVL
jgi:hypothetical protein